MRDGDARREQRDRDGPHERLEQDVERAHQQHHAHRGRQSDDDDTAAHGDLGARERQHGQDRRGGVRDGSEPVRHGHAGDPLVRALERARRLVSQSLGRVAALSGRRLLERRAALRAEVQAARVDRLAGAAGHRALDDELAGDRLARLLRFLGGAHGPPAGPARVRSLGGRHAVDLLAALTAGRGVNVGILHSSPCSVRVRRLRPRTQATAASRYGPFCVEPKEQWHGRGESGRRGRARPRSHASVAGQGRQSPARQCVGTGAQNTSRIDRR